jgi:3-deoxy-D-manno-octulosonic acid kinase
LPERSVPAGYAQKRERGALIVALPSVLAALAEAVESAGSVYAWAAAQRGARSFVGRSAAYQVPITGIECVVRHYHRGGFIARFNADRYVNAGEPRPLRELNASIAARAAGVPTPEVMAAIVYGYGLTYRADLVTRYISDSADLADVSLGEEQWSESDRVAAWSAAGVLLRCAFDAGVKHVDLNLRNVLIARTEQSMNAHLLDLDRAHVGSIDDAARHAMLARFHRSRRKLEDRLGGTVGARELDAFEAALDGGDRR